MKTLFIIIGCMAVYAMILGFFCLLVGNNRTDDEE